VPQELNRHFSVIYLFSLFSGFSYTGVTQSSVFSCRLTSVLPENAENLITNAHSRVFTQSSVFLYEVKIVQAPSNLITNAHSQVLYFIQFSESNMYVKVNVSS
jgi:hypothetical protein